MPSIAKYVPAYSKSKSGIMTGASSVLKLEIVTDSALSPFAKKVITLDVVPVGLQPRSTRPTTSMGASPKSLPIPNPTRGIHTYKVSTPTITSFGLVKTSLKSFGLIDRPIPSMIIPRQTGIQPPYGINGSGMT